MILLEQNRLAYGAQQIMEIDPELSIEPAELRATNDQMNIQQPSYYESSQFNESPMLMYSQPRDFSDGKLFDITTMSLNPNRGLSFLDQVQASKAIDGQVISNQTFMTKKKKKISKKSEGAPLIIENTKSTLLESAKKEPYRVAKEKEGSIAKLEHLYRITQQEPIFRK